METIETEIAAGAGEKIEEDAEIDTTHVHMACPALYPLPYSRAAFLYIFTALELGAGDDDIMFTPDASSIPSTPTLPPIPLLVAPAVPFLGVKKLEGDPEIAKEDPSGTDGIP